MCLHQLFHVFDRQNYSRLIPIHLSRMYALPKPVLDHFESGAFVSSIRGFSFSNVAVDEAHEMLINKDCKNALSHSLPTDMHKVSQTLEFQSELIKNFQSLAKLRAKCSVISHKLYFVKLLESRIFYFDQSPSLFQAFTKSVASKVQQNNLLTYRDIGRKSLNLYIKSNILKDASVEKPKIRKHNLQTFTKKKLTKRTINCIEKEKRLITMCYKRTIAYSEETQLPVRKLCQFLETPRAVCTPNVMPYKGSKSVIYDLFNERYLFFVPFTW